MKADLLPLSDVEQSPEQFTYDADGNMTSDGRFRYTWNGENRLVEAHELCAPTSRPPYTVTYAYDHKGRMVSKRITEDDGSNSPISILHSTFVWDDWNIIREIQVLGVRDQGSGGSLTTNDYPLITDNVWGLDLDGTLQGAGGVGGLLAVFRFNSSTPNSSTQQLFFPTYDANGNVSEYVTTNGEIVAHYDYSPFGETLIESGPLADTFTHRFSTKPWCPITGLYEYQMRKYRPEIGRWMNRDPREEDGGVNFMCFSFNDILNKYDVLGNQVFVTFEFDAWCLLGTGGGKVFEITDGKYCDNGECKIPCEGGKLIVRLFPYIGYPEEVGPPAKMPVITNPLGSGFGASHSFPLANRTGLSASALFGNAVHDGYEGNSFWQWPIIHYPDAKFDIAFRFFRSSEGFSGKYERLFTKWSKKYHQTANRDGSFDFGELEACERIQIDMGNSENFDFSRTYIVEGTK